MANYDKKFTLTVERAADGAKDTRVVPYHVLARMSVDMAGGGWNPRQVERGMEILDILRAGREVEHKGCTFKAVPYKGVDTRA